MSWGKHPWNRSVNDRSYNNVILKFESKYLNLFSLYSKETRRVNLNSVISRHLPKYIRRYFIILFTFVPPDKPVVRLTPNFTGPINESGHFQVECTATGQPSPEVAWHTAGLLSNFSISQIPEGQRLIVHSVNVKDWKRFKCYARSEAGRDMKELEVEILSKLLLSSVLC